MQTSYFIHSVNSQSGLYLSSFVELVFIIPRTGWVVRAIKHNNGDNEDIDDDDDDHKQL